MKQEYPTNSKNPSETINKIDKTIKSLNESLDKLADLCNNFSSRIKNGDNTKEQIGEGQKILDKKRQEIKATEEILKYLEKYKSDLLNAIKSKDNTKINKIIDKVNIFINNKDDKIPIELLKFKLDKVFSKIKLIDNEIEYIESGLAFKIPQKQQVTIHLQSNETIEFKINKVITTIKPISENIKKYENISKSFATKDKVILERINNATKSLEACNIKITQLHKDFLANNTQNNDQFKYIEKEQLQLHDKKNQEEVKSKQLQEKLDEITNLYSETKTAKETLNKELENQNKLFKSKDAEIAKLSNDLQQEKLLHTQVIEQLASEKDKITQNNIEIKTKLTIIESELQVTTMLN